MLSHCYTRFNAINASLQLVIRKATALNAHTSFLQASKDENVWNRARQEHIPGIKKKKKWTEQKVVWQAYVKAMVTAHESCTQGELEQQQC